ncbi:MAG TPA: ATP-binding protein [Polyangiaceae bacterium]|nr:ATP-binding protein [Polyangiaceae bacterium]
MRGPRTLRSRLFGWFVGAILLAVSTSALVASNARPESLVGADAAARNVAERLALGWDDPEATRAYVAEVRDVTGFDVHLVRDPRRLGGRVRRLADRGGAIVPEGAHRFVIPVVRNATLIGGLDVEGFGVRDVAPGWWRVALALSIVLAVLSVMAGAVANQLARPLERLARAADHVGAGDIAFRTDVGDPRHRWVAREVLDVAVSFNRMADKVEAMVRGQRELLGAISHEIRSPLGRARIALEITRDRLPSGDDTQAPLAALDDLEKELTIVDSILRDLLDLTRSGLADLRKETRPLAPWLRERVADEPSPPPITLHVAPDAALVAVGFDPGLLGRAVHNLLVNARAHGHPPDAPIEVSLTVQGSFVRITVRDRGHGFADDFIARAFEPFVRDDAARTRPSTGAGYGLGLSIVRRIVEAHGGRVFARNTQSPSSTESAPGAGRGAEVGFELPASSAGR